ncbi:hypothetical protein EYF80_045946 [Liparis tanakae]|uniref:Uncharacterized protein n=1 Tax=Liparis tanakae TaxID=230148 RepID=A0A4Z2FTZ7_9TELE|nr:hypothetical protein EYF80_045946 [Liparis tanakae]
MDSGFPDSSTDSVVPLVALTPWECRYSAVLVMVCSTALASLSEKNFCFRIRSSSSPPRMSSVTMNTCFPLSYTWDGETRISSTLT